MRLGLAHRDLRVIREILTVLLVSKLSNYWPNPDLSSIEDESRLDTKSSGYSDLVKETGLAIKALGINLPRDKVAFSEYHLTSKKGPLGHGLMTSLSEFLHPAFQPIRKAIQGLGS